MGIESFLHRVTAALQVAKIPYMLTGSLASSIYGLPRATNDIDFVIAPDRSQLLSLLGLVERSGFYVSREEAMTALEKRDQFNVIDFSAGWKVDLILRKDREFSRTEFERRREGEVAGVPLIIASPEDVVIAKLEWARLGESERQMHDVAGIVTMLAGSLDVEYVEQWVAELGLHEQWNAARRKAG
ncbi:MAG TPA: hypothetical protein VF701_04990 [Thermoanaerobaculia bacterium]